MQLYKQVYKEFVVKISAKTVYVGEILMACTPVSKKLFREKLKRKK